MGFIYSFVTLDQSQLDRRRELLDICATVAQISGLATLFLINVIHHLRSSASQIVSYLSSRQQKERQSPVVSRFRRPRANPRIIWSRRINWWLDDALVRGWNGWGTKRQWMIAGIWTIWLLILVFVRTGDGMLRFPYEIAAVTCV